MTIHHALDIFLAYLSNNGYENSILHSFLQIETKTTVSKRKTLTIFIQYKVPFISEGATKM